VSIKSLIRALDPVELYRDTVGEPDSWQVDALRSNHNRMLLNASRQSGKSTVSAVLAVHRALYTPRSLVLLLSPTLRQSGELFKKCAEVYERAGRPVRADAETQLSLALKNGSRVVSLPGRDDAAVRGYSGVSDLIIDEASRVPDELYMSVRPMLAVSGGRLLALSTPFGTRGWWYGAWRGEEDWQRFEIPATEVPRISEKFLAEEKRVMGEWYFKQEYLCEFLDAEHKVFSREAIEGMFDDSIEAWAV
jgi:hypothetical protein